jgi:hypothetical protein
MISLNLELFITKLEKHMNPFLKSKGEKQHVIKIKNKILCGLRLKREKQWAIANFSKVKKWMQQINEKWKYNINV